MGQASGGVARAMPAAVAGSARIVGNGGPRAAVAPTVSRSTRGHRAAKGAVMMRIRQLRVMFLLLAIVAGSSACATSEQWVRWREHSSHFASDDHFVFSARNQGRHATPRVTQKDMDEAQVETWWGDPIVVRPDQLVKR